MACSWRCGSSRGDGESQDGQAGIRLAEVILARGCGLRSGPDDHRRAGAGERRAEGVLRESGAHLLEEGRAVGLVEAVGERRREELGGARGERRAEDGGPARGEGGVAVRDLGWKGGARLERVRALL